MAGWRPHTWSATNNRLPYLVAPMMGVLSGVIGRRPVQNSACSTAPLPGNKSLTTSSRVLRRASFRRRSKPASSAMPPTRMRWSKRVTATL
ncbi:Uncharacterised protein [Bordetella pertussis]|nr:Uncharacterised protein [Bordetella pertussis]